MNTYGRYPIVISHGKGCYLYDVNGKQYLDMAAGIATCCLGIVRQFRRIYTFLIYNPAQIYIIEINFLLGHAHAGLAAAVSQQMLQVHHCSNLYFIPVQAELAKWLTSHSCADKVC